MRSQLTLNPLKQLYNTFSIKGRKLTVETSKTERIQKREQNIKAKKLGIPAATPADQQDGVKQSRGERYKEKLDLKDGKGAGSAEGRKPWAGSNSSSSHVGNGARPTTSAKNRAGFEGKKSGFLNSSARGQKR